MNGEVQNHGEGLLARLGWGVGMTAFSTFPPIWSIYHGSLQTVTS